MHRTEKAILLVEDEANDAFFLESAFERVGVTHPLIVAKDGATAIAYLMGEGKFADRQKYPLPRLILLDLFLPGMTGFEVLDWLRIRENFAHLRVIVLSASNNAADVKRAYILGARGYILKPLSTLDLQRIVSRIKTFWLDTDHSPENSPQWASIILPPPADSLKPRAG